jgi:Protein of unknown function (DUF4058)
MLLQDHFRPPLSIRRHWHSFHNAWATYIASDLNAHLPEGYFAEPNVQFGVEIDVAAFEEMVSAANVQPFDPADHWTPPAPSQTVAFWLTAERVEVNIFGTEGEPVLAGAIELVSPAHKDRATHREAFISKCETYLRQGIGLVIVDVVTTRSANLHNELMQRVAPGESTPLTATLYAVGYQAITHADSPNLDIWQYPLTLGEDLPIVPLGLSGSLYLAVDLAATYDRTCREQRLVG